MDRFVSKMEMMFMEDVMEKKTFAFKLAGERRSDGKWKAREGVALASCTDTRPPFGFYKFNVGGGDGSMWC